MDDGTASADRRLECIALFAFALLTGWLNLHHEPWHDELQAWRIALDSSSIADMFANVRYEGHPPLFHLLLRLVGAFTHAWSAAVAMHWLIACLSAWIVLWHSPFTLLQRVLVVFGYFFVYEYAVIVRPYGLGVCLALGACAAWCGVPRRPGLAVLLLLLLATTSAIGLLLAIPLAMGMLVDAAGSSRGAWWLDRRRRRQVLLAGTLLGVTALAVIGLIIPPPDALYQVRLELFARDRLWLIGRAASIPARVLLPWAQHVPDGSTQWGSWVFPQTGRPGILVADIVSLLAMALMTFVVARRRAAAVLWIVSSVILLGFFAFVFGGGLRHHGYLIIAFLAAAWLAVSPARSDGVQPLAQGDTATARWRRASFTALLALMVLPSVQFAIAEVREPFSDASQIAGLLATDSLAAAPVVGLAYPWSQPVAALLQRPIYLPAESRFAMWAARRNVVQGPAAMSLADSTVRVLLATHCHVVVLSSRGNKDQQFVWPGARELALDAETPMAGAPLRVWVVTASRCPQAVTPGR